MRVLVAVGALLVAEAAGIVKPHVISFGKWTSVRWLTGAEEDKVVMLKVRTLMVDGKVKEYILGTPHEVTDRVFVVQRVFRINGSLPEEPGGPRWQWQRGGWLLVDRMTGRVSSVNLPEFDAFYSAVSWFRDYAAYCGVSEDGKKVYAIVLQLSRRKAVVKNPLPGDGVGDDGEPDSACAAPLWQRGPVRVGFQSAGGTKQTFAIRGHVVDLVSDSGEEDEGSK